MYKDRNASEAPNAHNRICQTYYCSNILCTKYIRQTDWPSQHFYEFRLGLCGRLVSLLGTHLFYIYFRQI